MIIRVDFSKYYIYITLSIPSLTLSVRISRWKLVSLRDSRLISRDPQISVTKLLAARVPRIRFRSTSAIHHHFSFTRGRDNQAYQGTMPHPGKQKIPDYTSARRPYTYLPACDRRPSNRARVLPQPHIVHVQCRASVVSSRLSRVYAAKFLSYTCDPLLSKALPKKRRVGKRRQTVHEKVTCVERRSAKARAELR